MKSSNRSRTFSNSALPALVLCLGLLACAGFASETSFKLASGEGLLFCDNADTHGKENLWLDVHGRAFYWDNPTPASGGFPLKIFPSAGAMYGALPNFDIGASVVFPAYHFAVPGEISLKVKATLPNNDKLRLFGGALSCKFTYNPVDNYPALGAYRNAFVGFYPEGIMRTGLSVETRLLGDVEFIAWKSFLPLKYYLNLGYRMSMNRDYADYDQWLLYTGVEYKMLGTDFFVEYALDALTYPLADHAVHFIDGNGNPHIFPYYFSENPMYLTPGIRIKYPNGLSILAAFPLLLSQDAGYKFGPLRSSAHPSWTDGFGPFYANWKVSGKISYPLGFHMTNAETIRKFMLMKNRGEKQVIDVDEAIKKEKETKPEKDKTDEEKMRDDIEKRKKEMMKDNLLQ